MYKKQLRAGRQLVQFQELRTPAHDPVVKGTAKAKNDRSGCD
tara:strand:+ start:660 stop:785 length:126 start_codon:yes stop_codon:yes gene_type:complete